MLSVSFNPSCASSAEVNTKAAGWVWRSAAGSSNGMAEKLLHPASRGRERRLSSRCLSIIRKVQGMKPERIGTMKSQALLLVAEDDPDDQYFFQEAIAVVCPREVEMHFAWDGAQLLKLLREKTKELHRRNLIVL